MANEIVTKSYDIDISKTGARPIVKLSQYDTRTVRVLFTVYDGTELQVIDGCTARVDGRRSDGTAFSKPCDIEAGSKVAFTVEAEMTNSAGMHDAELVIINSDGNPMGTQNFVFAVEKSPFNRESAATAEDRTLYDQYTTAVDTRVAAAIKKADDAVAADTGKVDKLVADTKTRIDAIVTDSLVPIERGGTGANDLAGAQAALWLSRLLEFKQLYYDYDKGWAIYAAHGFVWVYAYGVATAGGSTDRSNCPYVLTEEYRPKVLGHVSAPVLTNNGASWTGRLVVMTDGSIYVANAGSAGSTDARYGFVCYPIGV